MGTITGGASLILPDSASDCIAFAGNYSSYAHLFSGLSAGGITLEAMPDNFTSAVPVSGQDYITLAYYAFQPGYEPNNYGIKLVKIGSIKYYLR